MRYVFLPFTLLILLISCENNSTINKNVSIDSEMTATVVDSQEIQNESLAYESEFQKYPNARVDSMKITYANMEDTLVGYRLGDTLIVDGDIMFKYPPQGGMKHTTGIGRTTRLWPRKGDSITIPYTIASSLDQALILEGIRKWSDSMTGRPNGLKVRFIQRSSQPDYIHFMPSSKTRSFVGKVGGKQPIEIADWAQAGNVAHEIGHALGLYHEHTRSDRDTYLIVDPNCTKSVDFMHAFRHDPYSRNLGDYDFYSIMHYSPNVGCFQVKREIQQSLPKGIPGQRKSISTRDKKAMSSMYGL